MKIAIVGAGWAGMAAAVSATQAGHHATVFEASRAVGGRAKALQGAMPDGTPVVLDNGQHILIGAYAETLRLMQTVGVDPEKTLLRLPLALQFPDGTGLALPRWPSPLDAVGGILSVKGWQWADKWSLIQRSIAWQMSGFRCAALASVADLCHDLTARVMETLIEPLCVSALNTPAARASGQVFLRVLKDSLFGGRGSSNLLLPVTDLGSLFPVAAAQWLQERGAEVRQGARVESLHPLSTGWQVNGTAFDAVVWATSASNAAAALVEYAQVAPESIASRMHAWATTTQALAFEAITTVYVFAPGVRLPRPMLALRSDKQHPAQFVFDRGQLGGPVGLLAFVVSASQDARDDVQVKVLQQARAQLHGVIGELPLTCIQTIVEKRATFACTPGLQRPSQVIVPGLLACGDYIAGPYPATLEGAIRSGCDAIKKLETT